MREFYTIVLIISFVFTELNYSFPIDSNINDENELNINKNQQLSDIAQPLVLSNDQFKVDLSQNEADNHLISNQKIKIINESDSLLDDEKITKLNFAYDPRFIKSRNQMQAIASNGILLNGHIPVVGPVSVNPMHQPNIYNMFPIDNNQINSDTNSNKNIQKENENDEYYNDDEEYEDDEENETITTTTKKTDTIKKLRRPKVLTSSTNSNKINDTISMLNLPRNSRPNSIIDPVPFNAKNIKEKDVTLQLTDSLNRINSGVNSRVNNRGPSVWGTLTIIANNNNNVNINEDRLSMDELFELINRRNNKLYRADLLDYNRRKLEKKHHNDPKYKSRDRDPKGTKTNSSSIDMLKAKQEYEEIKDDLKYTYFSYNQGGIILINNLDGNLNKQIKKILGNSLNIHNENPQINLPIEYLTDEEIDNLLQNAIIINNDNNNNNIN